MSKRSLLKIPKKKILLALGVVLVIAAVGISQPILWPGGFGIGKDQSVTTTSVETVVKDAQGNTTKTVKTTKSDDGKTLWDWLSLLGVPVSLAVLGYVLQQLQQKRAEILAKEQREIAADETKEEVLQVYFDRLSVLLVDKNLLAIAAQGDKATDENQQLLASSKDVIRARTLSILQRFENDPERKTSVIQFLLEANVIGKLKLSLRFADLSFTNIGEANLEGANLNKANLRGSNLLYANLSNANLGGANLIDATCCVANLSNANLEGARLRGSNLNNANLSNANFTNADLSNTKVTTEQLATSKLCKTILPENITTDPDRNCNALGITGD
jgi:hypothetical protein